jgi:hypothetical protein
MSSPEPRTPVIANFSKAVNLIAPKPKAEFLELVKESSDLAYAGL